MNKKLILAGMSLILSASVSAQILISEVYEANGGTAKFVELHNSSGMPIDLAAGGWVLERTSNAGTTPTTIALTGTIAANDFYVIGSSDVDVLFGAGTLDQTNSNINHNGDDEYRLLMGMTVIDSFAGDRIGNTDNFADNAVVHRIASQLPNDGSWDVSTPMGPNAPEPGLAVASPSGFWESTSITANNGNASMVATPGTGGGAGGTELPVALQSFSVE